MSLGPNQREIDSEEIISSQRLQAITPNEGNKCSRRDCGEECERWVEQLNFVMAVQSQEACHVIIVPRRPLAPTSFHHRGSESTPPRVFKIRIIQTSKRGSFVYPTAYDDYLLQSPRSH